MSSTVTSAGPWKTTHLLSATNFSFDQESCSKPQIRNGKTSHSQPFSSQASFPRALLILYIPPYQMPKPRTMAHARRQETSMTIRQKLEHKNYALVNGNSFASKAIRL